MRAGQDHDQAVEHATDEVRTRVLGRAPSPLTALEGTTALLEMDRCEIGTPLGDLEALSPR